MSIHSFHVPVMGSGFTIDTPAKIAHMGISSVISLVDDTLIEQMREHYCQKLGRPYEPITKYQYDFRARRITAYLDLVDDIVKMNFKDVIESGFKPGSLLTQYFQLLDDRSEIKQKYLMMLTTQDENTQRLLQEELLQAIQPGSIDVNIMTKLDRDVTTPKRKPLPDAFSDALSAFRGFAMSKTHASIVFSAGINRRLYSYIAKFNDFYPKSDGYIPKKVIIKVSDYRSALIQGRFLAKKGIWVSEFRIESGLNCGGHAFASDGYLMGPILEEFRNNREKLSEELFKICSEALKKMNRPVPELNLPIRITAQGGIGTAEEHRFLMSYYRLDGTGWGSPFLLVPEATNVDDVTIQQLMDAKESDVYLSDVSPLGVPFNNLKNSESDREKMRRVALDRPGSACPKGHLVSNTEFTEKPICTASRQFQKLKVEQLQKLNLTAAAFKAKYEQIIQKACICHDLGEGVLIKNKVPAKKGQVRFPAICPGPNIAYFNKIVSLEDMIQHIYGRCKLLKPGPRPHMFIKELNLYADYFCKEVRKCIEPTAKQVKYFIDFKNNLDDGINYYKDLIPKMIEESFEHRYRALQDLQKFRTSLQKFMDDNAEFFNLDKKFIHA